MALTSAEIGYRREQRLGRLATLPGHGVSLARVARSKMVAISLAYLSMS